MTDERNEIALTDIKDGQVATVSGITGGQGMVERLTAMGIRPGKRITRFCSMYMQGPVTVRIDNVQLALGRELARKILVIPDEIIDENPACR